MGGENGIGRDHEISESQKREETAQRNGNGEKPNSKPFSEGKRLVKGKKVAPY